MLQDPEIKVATVDDESAVVSLWEACELTTDYNPPSADFRRAVLSPQSEIFVARKDNKICAAIMVGDDGHRAWIYYLATQPSEQSSGLGRKLVATAEQWASARGARKIQFMIRPSNAAVKNFYANTGFQETPRLVMAKWLDKETAANLPNDRT